MREPLVAPVGFAVAGDLPVGGSVALADASAFTVSPAARPSAVSITETVPEPVSCVADMTKFNIATESGRRAWGPVWDQVRRGCRRRAPSVQARQL